MALPDSTQIHRSPKIGFGPTPWTLVLTAALDTSSGSSEALELLCKAYWPPIFSHVRMRGFDRHQAEDHTQEFFSRLLKGNFLASASPDKGRFRSFILAALRHFLINEWKRDNTIKRGGEVSFVNLEALPAPLREACEPMDDIDPELAFDRQWALTVIFKVQDRLLREYEAAGQFERHERLKIHLMDAGEDQSYADTAKALGLSDAATKSAIHRIRRRFAELLRAEITRTVVDPADVEDEIRHLLAALRHF